MQKKFLTRKMENVISVYGELRGWYKKIEYPDRGRKLKKTPPLLDFLDYKKIEYPERGRKLKERATILWLTPVL